MDRPITKRAILALVFTTLALAAAACVPAYKDADAGVKPSDSGVFEDAAAAEDAAELPDAGMDPLDAFVPDAPPPPPPDAGFVPDIGPVSDQDMDGIPDNEDPAPQAANANLFRDSFDTEAMGWTFTSVSMGIEESRGLLGVRLVERFVREGWIGPRPGWFDYYARTLLHVTAVGTSPDPGSGRAGLIARVSSVSPDGYYFCAIDLDQAAVVLTEHAGGGPDGTVLASSPITLSINEWVVLGIEVRGGGITCRAGDVTAVGASTTYTTGSIGFRAYDATFEADFLEVYDL